MEWLIVIVPLGAVFFAWLFYSVRPFQRKSQQDGQIPHLRGTGQYQYDIVGESRYQSALARIAGPKGPDGKNYRCVATIVLEDDNPHDSQAVRVDIDGMTVGHFSREGAREFRQWFAQKKIRSKRATMAAMIVGGWDDGHGDTGYYGVKLDV